MGNVYMEADQVRFKNSTYHNVQDGLAAALEGGGGGGTTVVANPEGSATADLAKLQVGTTIYGIPETAAKVTYDNTSSGLTADDVQEAIDELNTGLSGVTELIPSGATSSNKLATASDIPDAVTGNPSGSATAGNLTKLQIGSDIYNVPSGTSSIAYVDTSDINLGAVTWAQAGTGGLYYTVISDVIPANTAVIAVTFIAWENLKQNDFFMFTQSATTPRNIIILSNNGTFTSESFKLRISYISS